VKLTAHDPPDYLRQDMTVSVDIQVDKRAATLIAPARTVHDAGKEAPWALVVRDGRARMQRLRLGLRAGAQVEILEGLAPGDLLVPAASGVRAGQRIRAVPS
jgi:HlyD family secretion protein